MKLADLEPSFVDAGGSGVTDRDGNPVPERRGVGLVFECPCGCDSLVYVPFANPVDGGPSYERDVRPVWTRTGEDFDTLTLAPSIQRVRVGGVGCAWHGFVTNGEILTCP